MRLQHAAMLPWCAFSSATAPMRRRARCWYVRGASRCVLPLPTPAPPQGRCTALHLAAQNGRETCVEALLQLGAEPDARNKVRARATWPGSCAPANSCARQTGHTPLHCCGTARVAELLVNGGADTFAKDRVRCRRRLSWRALLAQARSPANMLRTDWPQRTYPGRGKRARRGGKGASAAGDQPAARAHLGRAQVPSSTGVEAA